MELHCINQQFQLKFKIYYKKFKAQISEKGLEIKVTSSAAEYSYFISVRDRAMSRKHHGFQVEEYYPQHHTYTQSFYEDTSST